MVKTKKADLTNKIKDAVKSYFDTMNALNPAKFEYADFNKEVVKVYGEVVTDVSAAFSDNTITHAETIINDELTVYIPANKKNELTVVAAGDVIDEKKYNTITIKTDYHTLAVYIYIYCLKLLLGHIDTNK